MRFIADLHVHSRHSIATSKKSDLEGFYQWAQIKGINLVGTGDFTHPGWFGELKDKLVPEEDGFFRLRDKPKNTAIDGLSCQDADVRFCLSSEISSIYKKGGQVRKVHSLIFAPDLETAAKISAKLSTIGNIKSDGRPILGLDPKDLLEIILEISSSAYLIPAHIWTPWFSLFGSKSGFDAIEDCFEDLTDHIFALETGLSSDPAMNWMCSALDRYALVSHSDAHSPAKLGREADLFEADFSYDGMFDALKTRRGHLGTIEFYPEEGKYHLDGHRKCRVCMDPKETERLNGRCPICGKKLTIGVLHRVVELADRSESRKPPEAGAFHYVVPLQEMLSEILTTAPGTKAVVSRYREIIGRFGSEFTFLLESPLQEIQNGTDSLICEAVKRMRDGNIHPQPGYDGQFGVIRIFEDEELERLRGQGTLFDTSPIKPHVIQESTSALEAEALSQELFIETEQLNAEQQRVLEISSGAGLITAGPGTGKTRTLISWIVKLIEGYGVPARNILAITFTNRAAREMADRLETVLQSSANEVTVSTFHALCFDLLRLHHPRLNAVYDESAREALLRLLKPDAGARAIARDSSLLQRLMEGTADRDLSQDADTVELIGRYRRKLGEIGAVDISDLITQLNSLFSKEPVFLKEVRNRFRYIAVDEFQDINRSQYQLLAHLACDNGYERGVLAIGDPDQAIYGFRGSDVRLFFQFNEDYEPREITLYENYRSTPEIVEAAKHLISQNTLSSGVPLKALRSNGSRIALARLDRPFDEGVFVARAIEEHMGGTSHVSIEGLEDRDQKAYSFADFAVLARTRAVRDELVPVLSSRGIPLSLGENRSLTSVPPLSYALPVLKLVVNPRDLSALSALLTHALPDIDHRALGEKLLLWSETDSSLFELLESVSINNLSAIHGTPQSVHAFEQARGFIEDVTTHARDRGLADTLQRIWDSAEITEIDAMLRAEALIQMAKEYDRDIEGFLRRISLSPFESEGPLRTEKVRLLTFHAAKGLEFPVIFIVGVEEGVCPIASAENSLEEERRLLYVALTRARDRLYLTSCKKRRIFGIWREMAPSRFLAELPLESIEIIPGKKQRPKETDQQLTLF